MKIVELQIDKDEKFVLDTVRQVLKSHGKDKIGFVFMIWGSDGSSTCKTDVKDGSRIPSILVPDFVRNRLLYERVEQWVLDEVEKNKNGGV